MTTDRGAPPPESTLPPEVDTGHTIHPSECPGSVCTGHFNPDKYGTCWCCGMPSEDLCRCEP